MVRHIPLLQCLFPFPEPRFQFRHRQCQVAQIASAARVWFLGGDVTPSLDYTFFPTAGHQRNEREEHSRRLATFDGVESRLRALCGNVALLDAESQADILERESIIYRGGDTLHRARQVDDGGGEVVATGGEFVGLVFAPELAELAQESPEHLRVRLSLHFEQQQPRRADAFQRTQLSECIGGLIGRARHRGGACVEPTLESQVSGEAGEQPGEEPRRVESCDESRRLVESIRCHERGSVHVD